MPQLPERLETPDGLGDGLVELADGTTVDEYGLAFALRREGEASALALDLAGGDLAAAWALGVGVAVALLSGGGKA